MSAISASKSLVSMVVIFSLFNPRGCTGRLFGGGSGDRAATGRTRPKCRKTATMAVFLPIESARTPPTAGSLPHSLPPNDAAFPQALRGSILSMRRVALRPRPGKTCRSWYGFASSVGRSFRSVTFRHPLGRCVFHTAGRSLHSRPRTELPGFAVAVTSPARDATYVSVRAVLPTSRSSGDQPPVFCCGKPQGIRSRIRGPVPCC